MQIIETIKKTQDVVSGIRKSGSTIGFVPTMGALHEGHLELLRKARLDNDLVVCSIFVNPKQFNNTEDLDKYPRTLERDTKLLKSVGCDLLFHPSATDMYPEKTTKVYDFGHLDKVMEGKYRPGHFNGVAVVVSRLFDIVRPDRAYFGEKDFQQLAIIQKLVQMDQIPVEIVPCPIVREPDGLAMSSRNQRLTPEERRIAPFIYQCLNEVREKAGILPVEKLKTTIESKFRGQAAFNLEYFEIVDMQNLMPVKNRTDSPDIIACVATYLGKVRLIDNIILFRNFAPLKNRQE